MRTYAPAALLLLAAFTSACKAPRRAPAQLAASAGAALTAPTEPVGIGEFRGKRRTLEGKQARVVGYLGEDLNRLYESSEHARVAAGAYSICIEFRGTSFTDHGPTYVGRLSDHYISVLGTVSNALTEQHLGMPCPGLIDIHEIEQASDAVSSGGGAGGALGR